MTIGATLINEHNLLIPASAERHQFCRMKAACCWRMVCVAGDGAQFRCAVAVRKGGVITFLRFTARLAGSARRHSKANPAKCFGTSAASSASGVAYEIGCCVDINLRSLSGGRDQMSCPARKSFSEPE